MRRARGGWRWGNGERGWRDATACARLLAPLTWPRLDTFGPGTLVDLKWWTGLTVGQVKRALTAIGPTEVDLGGTTGLVSPGDDDAAVVDAGDPVEPWVALLPSLYSTVMGWKERHWYLGDHGPALFDTNGNAGPTVWWDGRVVGGWAQRQDGEIVVRLLEDVGADARAAAEAEAEAVAAWLGPVRFTPRFPTPLERQLAT